MAGLGKRVAPLVAGALVAAGLAVAPAYAGDAIDGPLTSGDSLFPNQGNGGYDVSHYDVDIAWTPAVPLSQSTIDATTTITATTTGQPLSSFGLDLQGPNLTVSSVKVNNVPAATFTRIEQADGATPGQHKLVITPATPVDGPFDVEVDYGGIPSTRHDTDGSDSGWIPTGDGATFMNQPIGSMTGFPNNNNPKDKATYTFTIEVPDALEVVSNGEPTSNTSDGVRRTWVWNETRQMASELALISIGQYEVLTSDISLSGGRQVPEWTFVDSNIWATSSSTINARRAQLSPVLTGLESFLGPYPGKSTGIVVDTTGVGYALETQDRPTWPSAGSVAGSLVHEFVHQWYGDAVAPADWNGLWVNEGMATWAPTNLSGNNTETTYFNTWNNTVAGSSLWQTPPSGMTVPVQLFDWQSYTRGAMTYEALRAAISDPAFFLLIKKWQTDFGGQTKKWTDLIALAEQLSGRDLTAFFQDWIYDANKPAWPGKLSLVLDATPPPGHVDLGSSLTYSLAATNTGKVPLTGAQVALDLSDVLDDATLGALPPGVTQNGTTLTWAVPNTPLGNTASTSIPVTVKPSVSPGNILLATASVATLGGTCTSCTAAHAVDVDPPLTPAPKPTISGDPHVGTTLTAVPGAWPTGTTWSYQWTVDGSVVPTATQSTYVPVAGDAGKPVRVQVTGSKAGFISVTKESEPTGPVIGNLTSTPTPTISGTPKLAVPLTAVAGTWDAGVALAYQWTAGGANILGATGQTYTPVLGDLGKTITVKVTGTKDFHTPVTKQSAPTAAVAAGDLALTPVPTVVGTPLAGATLTVVPGTWDPGTSLAYQWLVAGAADVGATNTSYAVPASAVGQTVQVAVTGSRAGYTPVTRTSAPMVVMATAPSTFGAACKVGITGKARVGRKLSARITGCPAATAASSYQWFAAGKRIKGADEATYTIKRSKLGKRITVRVTISAPGYVTAQRVSPPTRKVR